MSDSRRDFFKKAGLSIFGFGAAGTLSSAFANAIRTEKWPQALDGKRWALVIDAAKCEAQGDCTACIDACHVTHNVPSIDVPNHEVKWLWKEDHEHTFPMQVHDYTPEKLLKRPTLVLCNHCAKPPCVRVCPTQATWKREADGIVMMDMHRCIGCRYCVVACPYGSRSFNWTDPRPHIKNLHLKYPSRSKGVVEKCNFCAERLAEGKIPACVEACKKKGCGALAFGDLGDPNSEVALIVKEKQTLRRKPLLGTEPNVYYVV